MEQPNWSKWNGLRTLDFSSIPSSSGVYQIRWGINGKPQVIRRANGDDDSGLLYIGKSKNLQDRIKKFWRRIHGRGGHTAGWTYDFYEYRKKFKPEQMEVRWVQLPEDEIGEMEVYLLLEYVGKYLDRPPLNISIPRY